MNQVTTLPKAEIEKVSKQFSADTGYTFSGKLLRTVDDCVEQYNKAEEVSKIAQMVIKDRMQGDALLKAKKLICGDEWNRPKLTDKLSAKWKAFLLNIDCKIRNADILLDFAGYKEQEEKLIEQGVEVVPITTASHYREVKKLAEGETQLTKKGEEIEVVTHEHVATTYTQAVKVNGGVIPKTAKEVVKVIHVAKKKVSSESLFLKEFPEYENIPNVDNRLKADDVVGKLIPRPDKDEWKHFYRLVAKVVHPDKGGTEVDMSILTGLKEVYEYLHKQNDNADLKSKKMRAYESWCEVKGCKIFDWIDEE